jgi:hypothetical protein
MDTMTRIINKTHRDMRLYRERGKVKCCNRCRETFPVSDLITPGWYKQDTILFCPECYDYLKERRENRFVNRGTQLFI